MAHKPLPLAKAHEILRKADLGRLGTCRDGEPYVIPLSFVYHEGKIFLHCGSRGLKLDIIAANPRVCFQVDDEIAMMPRARACSFTAHYYSAIVFGTARLVRDPDLRLAALRALVAKYDPEGLAPELTQADLEGQEIEVVEIEPERITGVDHARLPAPE